MNKQPCNSENKILSFGIMCNGFLFQRWQADCIKLLLKNNFVCALLIIDDNPLVRKTFLQKAGRYFNTKGFYNFYQRFFFRPKSKELVCLEKELKNVAVIKCRTNKKKYSEYFTQEDQEKTRSAKLDFILRFAFNIIRGEILDCSKFGIWSFHHDDEKIYRGGPPGFWEIYKNDNINAAILQRLTNRLDAGIVLKKGFFKTVDHSYSGNIDNLYFGAAEFPLQVCKNILNGVFDKDKFKESQTKAPVYKSPYNWQMFKFLLKIFVNKLKFHYSELFRTEDWNIGVLKHPAFKILQGGITKDVFWMPENKKGGYFADPFAFQDGKNLQVVFEDFSYFDRKGIISGITFSGDGFDGPVKPLIEEKCHLSYPYIFTYKNEVFCIPESAGCGKINLFKFNRKTSGFDFVTTLLENTDAVDPTIIFYEKRWWLFFTKTDYSNTKLYIYFSENLNNKFLPHKNNSVKTDVRSARPAGTPFFHEGHLFRPAQDCSVTYGGRIVVNRILKLSPTEYNEIEVTTIEPLKGQEYNKGLHTFAAAGDYTIIDGKRFVFNRNNFIFQLRKKFSKLLENKP